MGRRRVDGRVWAWEKKFGADTVRTISPTTIYERDIATHPPGAYGGDQISVVSLRQIFRKLAQYGHIFFEKVYGDAEKYGAPTTIYERGIVKTEHWYAADWKLFAETR